MRLVGLAVVLTPGLLAAPLTTEAQQSGKPRRIGMLFLVLRAAVGFATLAALPAHWGLT